MTNDHTPVVHENCEYPHCPICEGGLTTCSVCGGAEGSLPTHCPGERMDERLEEAVMAGSLNFVDGRWQMPYIRDGVQRYRDARGQFGEQLRETGRSRPPLWLQRVRERARRRRWFWVRAVAWMLVGAAISLVMM